MREFDKFYNFNKSVLAKYFPKIEVASVGGLYGGDAKGPYSNANFKISLNNRLLESTAFQPRVANRFIHFTSLENLLSILREKVIRIYSLETMNDSSELNVFAKVNSQYEKEINSYKKNIWSFSFCNSKVEDNLSSLHMWREYTNNGRGCAMEFKFLPGINYPFHRFLIAKISYDENSKYRLRFLKDCEEYLLKNNLKINNFHSLLACLSPFFKEKVFAYEREYRLLYLPQDPDDKFNILYGSAEKRIKELHIIKDFKRNTLTTYHPFDIDNNGIEAKIKTRVNQLLSGEKFYDYFGEKYDFKKLYSKIYHLTPKIEITKVILGPSLYNKEKYEISTLFSELLFQLYKKNVPIEDSKLSKYFIA